MLSVCAIDSAFQLDSNPLTTTPERKIPMRHVHFEALPVSHVASIAAIVTVAVSSVPALRIPELADRLVHLLMEGFVAHWLEHVVVLIITGVMHARAIFED